MKRILLFLISIGIFTVRGHCQNAVEPVAGPWGTLIGVPIILEPPYYSIIGSPDLQTWRNGTVWKFQAENLNQVEEQLVRAELSSDLIRRLIDVKYVRKSDASGLFEIRPPDDIILSLSSLQREKLYPLLMPRNDDNPFYGVYSLPPGGIDSVVHISTGVPNRTIDLIRHLTYKVGKTYRFADINYVFEQAEDNLQRIEILKILGRRTAWSLHLKVDESDSLAGAASYWSAEGRNKEILPVLESISSTSGINKLDVVHLLPPFPRKMLFTYPAREGEGIGEKLPDCFWTAVSFFSESPPDRHLDNITHIVQEKYSKVSPSSARFGDVLIFTDKESGEHLHACNYIAAGYVFTKNGVSIRRPWVFATLDAVVKTYLERDLTIAVYRLKSGYRK